MAAPAAKRLRRSPPEAGAGGHDAGDSSQQQQQQAQRGGRAFLVPDLPEDFAGIPLDGAQYLALVRRQASAHAPVYRVRRNPYADAAAAAASTPTAAQGTQQRKGKAAKGKAARGGAGAGGALLSARSATGAGVAGVYAALPSEPSLAWREAFAYKFRCMRHALRGEALLAPDARALAAVRAARAGLPLADGASEGAWWKWVFGVGMRAARRGPQPQAQASAGAVPLKADAQGPAAGAAAAKDEDKKPWREPSTAVLRALEHEHILQLLEYMPGWFVHPSASAFSASADERSAPSGPGPGFGSGSAASRMPDTLPPLLARWAFALLAALSAHLDAEEVSVLRTLARAAAAAIVRNRWRFRTRAKALRARQGRGREEDGEDGEDEEGEGEGEEEQRQGAGEADMLISDDEEEEGQRGAQDDDIAHVAATPRRATAAAAAAVAAHLDAASASPLPLAPPTLRMASAGGAGTDASAGAPSSARAALAALAEDAQRAERSAWLLVAAVAAGWGQSDLWDEASNDVARVALA